MAPQLSQGQLSAIKVHQSLQHLNIPVTQWMAENPGYRPIASALIFDGKHTLLIQRAPTDVGALAWEYPGGACERDETIMEGTARELFEESGLITRSIDALLDEHELPEELLTEDAPSKWKFFSFLVEIESTEGKDVKKMVKLDPKEHCAFIWATEEDVRMGRCGEVLFKWADDDQRKMTILRGFEAMKGTKR